MNYGYFANVDCFIKSETDRHNFKGYTFVYTPAANDTEAKELIIKELSLGGFGDYDIFVVHVGRRNVLDVIRSFVDKDFHIEFKEKFKFILDRDLNEIEI